MGGHPLAARCGGAGGAAEGVGHGLIVCARLALRPHRRRRPVSSPARRAAAPQVSAAAPRRSTGGFRTLDSPSFSAEPVRRRVSRRRRPGPAEPGLRGCTRGLVTCGVDRSPSRAQQEMVDRRGVGRAYSHRSSVAAVVLVVECRVPGRVVARVERLGLADRWGTSPLTLPAVRME